LTGTSLGSSLVWKQRGGVVMDGLPGSCAIVTGAAGGIGAGIAQALAGEGVNLVLADNDAESLAAVAAALDRSGVQAVTVAADITRADDRAALVAAALEEFGRIDVLVNNAAVIEWSPFVDQDPERITEIVTTNLTATLLLTRAVLPGMVGQRSGRVVTVSSLEGKVGIAHTATYGATKAALLLWNAALRCELDATGVTATAVAPGYVTEAGMWARWGIPAPRLGGAVTPDRVAQAVVRALRQNRQEVIVRSTPTRPLLALIALRPELGGQLLKVMGIDRQMKRLVSPRGGTPADVKGEGGAGWCEAARKEMRA
jgi:short-subunit dehydrogenase